MILESNDNFKAQDSAYSFLFLIALLSLYVECYFFWQYIEQSIRFSVFIALHTYVVFFWISWVSVLQFLNKEKRLSIVGLFLIFFLGPFGAIAYIVMLVMYCLFTRKEYIFSEWFAALFPEEDMDETERVYERIVFGLEDISEKISVEPFQDILTYGTLVQKQDVLSKISRHFKPEFSKILINALNSSENAVRVQAASCLSKIENQFMDRYVYLQQKMESHPESLAAINSFGEYCVTYANSGILDEDRQGTLRRQAIEMFLKAESLNKKCNHTKFMLGMLYLQEQDLKKAESYFNKCKKDNAVAASPDFVIFYMDVLFQLKQYAKLRRFANTYKHKMDDMHASYVIAADKISIWKGAV